MTTAADKPAITAIAPWFGGKRTMAPLIVQQLGNHRSFYDPFCGSCAVLFAKPVSSIEIVSDLHGDLVNLARILSGDRWRELYEAVDRLLLCEEWLADFRGDAETDFASDEPDVDRAARYMALAWMTRNGTAGAERTNQQLCVRWTQNGGGPGIRWRAAVDSVPAWHDRLKGVVILRRDAFEVIPRVEDQVGTVVYCDPPYLRSSRSMTHSGRYLYDFEETALLGDDHDRLARELRRFTKARVVVSYYDHPRLAELYPGWTKIDCARQKNLAVQNRRGMNYTEAPEVLLLNGPNYA